MAQSNLNLDVRPGFKLVHKTDGNREEYYYERHFEILDGSISGLLPTLFFVGLLIVGMIWLSDRTETNVNANDERKEQVRDTKKTEEEQFYRVSSSK